MIDEGCGKAVCFFWCFVCNNSHEICVLGVPFSEIQILSLECLSSCYGLGWRMSTAGGPFGW